MYKPSFRTFGGIIFSIKYVEAILRVNFKAAKIEIEIESCEVILKVKGLRTRLAARLLTPKSQKLC